MKKHLLSELLLGAVLALWAESALAAQPGLAPQVNNANGVKVTASLQHLPNETQGWDFTVTLETHAHTLNEHMENVAVLVADGRQYAPISWEGSPRGGHHRKGVLRFPAVSPPPAAVELRIALAIDSAQRVFRWSLQSGRSGKGAGYGK